MVASQTRTYSSPLRAEQRDQVRERILAKVGEVLADPATTDLSVAEVARRAGVSVRTVYRYYPTKEALSDAFNESISQRFGASKLPDRLEELPPVVSDLFHGFERNADLVKAMRFSKVAGEIRARRKVSQKKAIAKVLAAHTSHLEEPKARGVAAVFSSLLSSEVWLTMTETWGMTTDQASWAVKWAMETLQARLQSEGKRGR